ncbi:MAG TPA: endonuclease/exonuclease/phosphatase family protein [Salinimicrobium sp.]|nr:endonuclease/exonuclease/phosphatase family protein [Salinimicrobium sp.]
MKNSGFLWLLLMVFIIPGRLFSQEKVEYKILTVAFYNLENLFDTINDPITFDDDRTPEGKDQWTQKIYEDKLKKMSFAISQIGVEEAGNSPVLLGVSEIENQEVLEDLIKQPALVDKNYGIVHYDSPDRRGIDVALLFQIGHFQPRNSVVHELVLFDSKNPDQRVYTRDQLVVSGILEGEEINIIVNHWPSRSGGTTVSSYKRELAAALNRKIIDSLQKINPYAKIITMGDLNDDPQDKSIKVILGARADKEKVEFKGLFNPMAAIAKKGIGSLGYRDGWNLFDQIIISQPFLEKDYSSFRFYKANIFNANFLTTPSGQFKGYPFRSFGFGGYTGGYSDHFPVYIYLIKKVAPDFPKEEK